MFRRFDARACDPRNDVALPQQLAASGIGVALVGVELRPTFSGTSGGLPDRADAVDHVLQQLVVVEVGGRDVHVQRQSTAVADRVDLGTGLAPVYRAGPAQVHLLTARTCMLSMLARDQSMHLTQRRMSSVAWCRALITPRLTHSPNRRCAVRQCTGNEPGS